MAKKGKFVVLDGIDGTGKATQSQLLVRRLKQAGRRVKRVDFPRYGKKSAALVEEYLRKNLGDPHLLGPYAPSLFYAVDRFAASRWVRAHLDNGLVVVADRYVTANLAHQGGKIRDRRKRHAFFRWLLNLEYQIFKIPRPDLTIILHAPAGLAQRLVGKKRQRAYTRGRKRDAHESDLAHLRAAERSYLEIAKNFRYPVVECAPKGRMLSRPVIARRIWDIVKPILK